jgi:hypothetical protein
MNSSSTPSVIPPAARAVPDGSPGTVTSGPVPSGSGIAAHPAGLAAADLIVASYTGFGGVSRRGPSRPSLPAPSGSGLPATATSQTIVCNPLDLTITRPQALGQGQMSRRPGTIGRRAQAPGPYPVTGPPAGAWGEGQQLVVSLSDHPVACLGHLVPGSGQVTDRLADHQPGVIGRPPQDLPARGYTCLGRRTSRVKDSDRVCPRWSSRTRTAARRRWSRACPGTGP